MFPYHLTWANEEPENGYVRQCIRILQEQALHGRERYLEMVENIPREIKTSKYKFQITIQFHKTYSVTSKAIGESAPYIRLQQN